MIALVDLEQAPLTDRLAPALVWLGLSRRINWQEAAYVLQAVAYFNEREAVRWHRQQELIAIAEARL